MAPGIGTEGSSRTTLDTLVIVEDIRGDTRLALESGKSETGQTSAVAVSADVLDFDLVRKTVQNAFMGIF